MDYNVLSQVSSPKPQKAFAIAFAALALALAGCASGLGVNTYEQNAVGAVSRVDEGRVVASRAPASTVANNAVASAATSGAIHGDSYAYTVRLASGELVTINQGGDTAIANGTPVLVEYGARARVIPQNASIGY